MKERYSKVDDFKDDLHKLSLKELVIEFGYVKEEDFKHSKVKCLFHEGDRTPSLQITDKFFRCYGCGVKGDIINFVELYENMNYFEAIKFLAEKLNTIIDDYSIETNTKIQNNLNKEWQFYKDNMAKLYSNKDKQSIEIINKSKRFFPYDVGYDPKTNYMVLPFTSKSGNILGFTKRRVDDNSNLAKWVHSSLKDTLIKYCSNIFNLSYANKSIKKTGSVILVEGPGDVCSVMRAGLMNVIAICGASNFSDKILNVLGPIKFLYVMTDADKGGNKSRISILSTLSKINPRIIKNVMNIELPEGKDPGDLNQNEIMECYDNAKPLINWFMYNGTDDEIIELYNSCTSSLVRPLILNALCESKNYNYSQAEEFFMYKPQDKKKEDDYKDRLLATIGHCENMNVQPLEMDGNKAIKILKMRYGIEIKEDL
jgi:DNA primase